MLDERALIDNKKLRSIEGEIIQKMSRPKRHALAHGKNKGIIVYMQHFEKLCE